MPFKLDIFRSRVASGLDSFKSFSPSTLGQGSTYGATSAGGFGGSWGNSSAHLTGTRINYAALVGDLWSNSAVAACLNWIITAFPEAPPCIKEFLPNGKSNIVHDSFGLTELINNPNDFYDDTVLWAGTVLSYITNGNSYWFVVRDGRGRPAQLWYIPHFQVTPRWDTGDFISYYEYRANGIVTKIPVEDVIHFRFGVDPYNPRLGLAPLASVVREVYTDTEATNYGAAILRNFGTVGGIVSPKDPNASEMDPETFVKLYQAKTTGDKRGEILAWDAPLDVVFPNNNPEKMALDVIRKYPEARICAVMGIPAMVVGLNVGLERSTFANYEESRSAAWEDCLLPMMRTLGKQATRQLLRRDYKAADNYFIGFNTAEIRVMQPDQDALHTRAREDYKANLLDRAQALAEIGAESTPADKGVYYAAKTPTASKPGDASMFETENAVNTKETDNAGK
jgi:HK97 family phage portal protein